MLIQIWNWCKKKINGNDNKVPIIPSNELKARQELIEKCQPTTIPRFFPFFSSGQLLNDE